MEKSKFDLAKSPKIRALTVGTTVIELVPSNPKRRAFLVVNNSANIIYILSNKGQSSSDGIPVHPDKSYSNSHCYGKFFVVASAANSDVRIEEDLLE